MASNQNVGWRRKCGLISHTVGSAVFELDETIPDHSTFSKTRTRKWQQSSLFQRAFQEIV